jgi:Raf kinase inhibitor-like YbhB/YbcL family protein
MELLGTTTSIRMKNPRNPPNSRLNRCAVRHIPFLGLVLGACIVGSQAQAQQGDGTNVGWTVHVFKPAKVEATPERIAQIQAPPGFKVTLFAHGLKNARVIAVAPNGDIYVSRRDQGDVVLLKMNAQGAEEGSPVIVANRSGAHGLAIRDNKLYLATVKQLFVADIQPDGRLGPLTLLIKDLADAGQHADRTIAFGPDGQLYISVGATCNACNEDNPENATMLRATPDGKTRRIFATGLRNTIGFDWNPTTGELWGLDNGIDFLGDDSQPEELNKIEFGKQYGWPHIYGAGEINPQSTPPGGITKEEWKARSTPQVLGYTPHAAPMQLVFYTGHAFPAEYLGDAFATMRGSWNRATASGYEIVRIHFVNGQPVSFQPFVHGFLTDNGTTHIARPMGLAVAHDGSLLMADDANGGIFRIAYIGSSSPSNNAQGQPKTIPASAMLVPTSKAFGVPLAKDRPETRTTGTLSVTSSDFSANEVMPAALSEYAEAASPQLTWSAVPNARSYVVIMEDPDAKPLAPIVHWLIWNIPASLTQLPQGIQKQGRLSDPEGILQGRNTRGSLGYTGPHAPVGDTEHHYHVQVFALDDALSVPAGGNRDMMLAQMDGHVIAKGELVGRYAQTTNPPP